MNNDTLQAVLFFIVMVGIQYQSGNIIPEDLFPDRRIDILLQYLYAQLFESAVPGWRSDVSGDQSKQRGCNSTDEHRRHQLRQTYSPRLQYSDFVICGESAEGQQNRQQKSHWNCKDQKRRHQVDNHPADISQRYAARNNHISQLDKPPHQQNKSKNYNPQGKERGYFTDYVEGDDTLHDCGEFQFKSELNQGGED